MFSKAARAQANGKVSSDHCKTQCFKGEEAKLEMKWMEENVHFGPAGQNFSARAFQRVAGHPDASLKSNRLNTTFKKVRILEGSGELNRSQKHEEQTTHTHFMVDSAATDGEATRETFSSLIGIESHSSKTLYLKMI